MPIKESIQYFLRRQGILLSRFNAFASEIHQVAKACERSNCRVLFDIGANAGQFAKDCFEAGFTGTIVSVEPQTSAHTKLAAAASRNRNWTIAPRCAVGDVAGMSSIHIAENSFSSSLLNVTKISVDAEPKTRFIGEEDVEVVTMDNLAPRYVPARQVFALKLDTQGNEAAVLRGAKEILRDVGVLYLEMSLVPLYTGAPPFEDLFREILGHGYRCIGIFPGFTNPDTYEMLQVNALFSRSAFAAG